MRGTKIKYIIIEIIPYPKCSKLKTFHFLALKSTLHDFGTFVFDELINRLPVIVDKY